MNILDTNVILRFILQDDAEQAVFAEEQMSQDKYLIPMEVIAEVVFVLNKVYKVERAIIKQLIHDILYLKNSFIPHHEVVLEALRVYDRIKLDFVDCLLVGYEKIEGYKVISFDKKLNKQLKYEN